MPAVCLQKVNGSHVSPVRKLCFEGEAVHVNNAPGSKIDCCCCKRVENVYHFTLRALCRSQAACFDCQRLQ